MSHLITDIIPWIEIFKKCSLVFFWKTVLLLWYNGIASQRYIHKKIIDMKQGKGVVAYFSMEIALDNEIPNYAGGLGVLAADTLLSCADKSIDVVGISIIYHKSGDPKKAFDPARFMKRREEQVVVEIEDRQVHLAIWQMELKGKDGNKLPLFFLSSNVKENQKWDRNLTENLYSADGYTRLCQEIILGIGGARALEALGYKNISCYHMNEGHSVTLTLELLRRNNFNIEKVRSLCTFTSHTPIPAGHDYFDYTLAYKTFGKMLPPNIKTLATQETLSMTELALNMSKKANSVSKRHNDVCVRMFPQAKFENITNGIYHPRWIGGYVKKVLDKNFPAWETNPEKLVKAPEKIDSEELWQAHQEQKKELVDWINKQQGLFPFKEIIKDDLFSEDTLTIGFARRFVPYKRHALIFKNIEKLRQISHKKLQLIFAGRCHPGDELCNNIVGQIKHFATEMRGQVKIVVLKEYNLEIAKRLISGSDVWLNNPVPPREASGTSGMKAALNGGLNISILDGWWIEGYKMQPKSGWAFGKRYTEKSMHSQSLAPDTSDNEALLKTLENAIDCYYNCHEKWAERMKHAIALVSFFNTHRLVKEYKKKMWS